jgi:hypothetical protein
MCSLPKIGRRCPYRECDFAISPLKTAFRDKLYGQCYFDIPVYARQIETAVPHHLAPCAPPSKLASPFRIEISTFAILPPKTPYCPKLYRQRYFDLTLNAGQIDNNTSHHLITCARSPNWQALPVSRSTFAILLLKPAFCTKLYGECYFDITVHARQIEIAFLHHLVTCARSSNSAGAVRIEISTRATLPLNTAFCTKLYGQCYFDFTVQGRHL